MSRNFSNPRALVVLAIILIGGLITATVSLQTVSVPEFQSDAVSLSVDEQAYYEFVAPRLEMLVTQTEATREMVASKSRDLISLTRAGTVIETLTDEIRAYGEDNEVPDRFTSVHDRIMAASETVNATFGEARTAIRTFNFSKMAGLVTGFNFAADEFIASNEELAALAN